ncbi:hypothetical protein LXA43DRAFT_530342 [Ganoderma leucocontextum]|nr:hypothetical protein LXA43DRAFT_530342 [Ganoderma leucocontextum]
MSSPQSALQSDGGIGQLNSETPRTQPVSAQAEYQDCLACRVIGTGALAGVGIYALTMSRARAPGSVIGKRIMGAVGVGFLIGSYFRWTK